MAHLESEIQFTGSLGKLSAYRMKGSDKIVVRTKGGASKEAIATWKSFELVRLNNAEFDRRAKGSAIVLRALQRLRQVADHRISGAMNALMKKFQLLDTTSALGERDIFLSRQPALLEGFSFNRVKHFDTVLMVPVTAAIQTASATVSVTIPAIIPGLNFRPSDQYPFCQFIITAGCIPDLVWSVHKYRAATEAMTTTDHCTEWLPVMTPSPERTIELSLSLKRQDINHTIVVGIGIQYGVVSPGGKIEPVRYGSAKILAARSIVR